MTTVYWAMKCGDLPVTTGARLVFVLAEIAKLLRDVEIEGRLAALERQL